MARRRYGLGRWSRLSAVPLLLGVAAVVGPAAGAAASTARAAAEDPAVEVADPPGTGAESEDPTASEETASADVRPPSRTHGAWVAKILWATTARPAPGSSKRGVPVGTTVASGYYPQELLVLARRTLPNGEGWLQVRLPTRPNGASGWIPEDAVRLRRTDWWVRIRTGQRTVSVYEKGRLRLRTRAVVGARATRTPHGLFAVLLVAKQTKPRGFLGPWALHLTAHSDVLDDYGGGAGRVALHGRTGASLRDRLGSARSHGCVRVPNREITTLARWLRAGTPVQITT